MISPKRALAGSWEIEMPSPEIVDLGLTTILSVLNQRVVGQSSSREENSAPAGTESSCCRQNLLVTVYWPWPKDDIVILEVILPF